MAIKRAPKKNRRIKKIRVPSAPFNLEDKRKRYRYEYTSIPTVAMLKGLPFEQHPSTSWSFIVGEKLLQILWNQILLEELAHTKRWQDWSSYSLLENMKWLSENLKSLANHFFPPGKSPRLKKQRDHYFELRRSVQDWELMDSIAPIVEITSKFDEMISEIFFNKPQGRPKSLKSYNELFQNIQIPQVYKTFRDDITFGYLRVAGPNPMVIEQVPPGWQETFPVTNPVFQSVASFEADTLEIATQENRLYLCNYPILDEIKTSTFPRGQKYLAAPKALFAISKDRGLLLPIAIQCNQSPDLYSNPIFTPHDGYKWEMAKTTVQVADGNYHELISHLSHTHLLLEAFMVAMHRQLPPTHPVYALLLPHFEGLAFINWAAKTFLVSDRGFVDKLLSGTIESSRSLTALALKNFSFNDAMLPVQLKKRRVDHPILDFPYRDDASMLWLAIHDWVKGYLALYYPTSLKVKNDSDLQNWFSEIVSEKGGRIHGFGEGAEGKISTFDYLVNAVTMIIFTASVQHAAVNFPQYTTMSYTPAVPLAAYTSGPLMETQFSEKDWFAQLPPLEMAHQQLAILYVLGSVNYGKLGSYPQGHFQNEEVMALLKQFQHHLELIETQIQRRNSVNANRGQLAYTTLLPSKIPQSTNI